MNLPPLPPSEWPAVRLGLSPGVMAYTAEQMQAYGQACRDAALERVIADQQKEIDRLQRIVDSNDKSFAGFAKSRERMALVAFDFINEPTSHDRMWALKLELQAQGWCVFCEASPCECDLD